LKPSAHTQKKVLIKIFKPSKNYSSCDTSPLNVEGLNHKTAAKQIYNKLNSQVVWNAAYQILERRKLFFLLNTNASQEEK
jgi:hypothetical protein